MVILSIVLLLVGIIIMKFSFDVEWQIAAGAIGMGLIIIVVIVAVDYKSQIMDREVWSGKVLDVEHKEEEDIWHPPKPVTKYKTKTYTDSKGKTKTKQVPYTVIKPGYTEHKYATNSIKTSDSGWISVNESPSGKRFDDNWPNTASELTKFWPIGSPTASVHTYDNYVQASYSIYKHEEIDLDDYEHLPDYPNKVRNYVNIDRIVGQVPNKEQALNALAECNAELNKLVPNPDKPGKMKSWKQVNLIFVNLGDVPKNEGFALQDKWENGNKNDFIVSFGMDSNGNVKWVYPFSWTEVEVLKKEISDFIYELETIEDFVPVVRETSNMVANKFERKEMADFNYLQIETRGGAKVGIFVTTIILLIVFGFIGTDGSYRR